MRRTEGGKSFSAGLAGVKVERQEDVTTFKGRRSGSAAWGVQRLEPHEGLEV